MYHQALLYMIYPDSVTCFYFVTLLHFHNCSCSCIWTPESFFMVKEFFKDIEDNCIKDWGSSHLYYIKTSFFIFVVLGLSSRRHACEAGTLQLEPPLQPILLWLFWS
jgi:hypothetical protein